MTVQRPVRARYPTCSCPWNSTTFSNELSTASRDGVSVSSSRHDVSPLEYLRIVLGRIGEGLQKERSGELLPSAWTADDG
jgi:hypothetical protein